MSVFYHLIHKVNPRDVNGPKRYYASLKRDKVVDEEYLAQRITRGCTVSPADVVAVLRAMQDEIPEILADGRIIKLGQLGSFSLTINSDSVEEPEQFHQRMIKKVVIRFRPAKAFKQKMAKVKFKRLDK